MAKTGIDWNKLTSAQSSIDWSKPKSNADNTEIDTELLAKNKKQVEEQVSGQRKLSLPDVFYNGIKELANIYSAPSETINKGLEQLDENPIAGALNVAQGIANTAFTMIGVPQLFSVISTANKAIFGEEAGKTFDDAINLPATIVGKGTELIDKGLQKLNISKQDQMNIARSTISNLISTGRPEFQVLQPLLTDKGVEELNSSIDEVNKLGATLLSFHALGKAMPKKTPKIGVMENTAETKTVMEDSSPLHQELQNLYNERNVRLNQRDNLTGSNQKFMDMIISKLDERIKPLEQELNVKATKLESENNPVENVTQEKLPTQLAKEKENNIPPTEKEMVSLRPEVTTKENIDINTSILPNAEKLTSDLPSLEELKNTENKSPLINTNSQISSLEAQGKEIIPKSIETINQEGQGSQNAFIKSPLEGKQVDINNIQSANDAIKFAEENKGNEEVLNQLKTNYAEIQTKAKEALLNDSPDAEMLQGKASILNDAVNELTKKNQEVLNGEGQTNQKTNQEMLNNIAPEENTFGASIVPLPTDFTLKNLKTNFNENTSVVKNVLAEGARLSYEGVKDFGEWSKQMVDMYGEKISPHLYAIWSRTQNIKDSKSEFAQDIIKYADKEGILDARSAKEKFLQANTENLRKLINGSTTVKEFGDAIKLASYETPKDHLRRIQLENKYAEEIRGGKKLTTDELRELESLSPVIDIKNGLKDSFRIPSEVAEKSPITNAVFQELFERKRAAEMEGIALKDKFNGLIDQSRKDTGAKYDDTIIRALGGEKVELTDNQKALVDELTKFRQEAGKYKTDAKLRENYDFPVKPRGFIEASHYDGMWEAISEKLKRFSPSERARLMKLYNSDKIYDVFSKERIGRTEHPTMDLKDRLDAYIDIYTLQKNVQPVLPSLNRLNEALRSVKLGNGKERGMSNVELWNRLYQKDVLGEKVQSNMFTPEGEAHLNKYIIQPLNRIASIRYLAYNAPGGLGNLVGGMVQNLVSPDITPKEFATGIGRVFTNKGQKLLAERGIVDAGSLEKSFNTKEIIKGVITPYSAYSLGENLIQGSFYLGKLTPEEFRNGLISASRDREILVGKAKAQGGYHAGLRPAITRTNLGNASMKFRLWIPAVLESKAQRIISVGNVASDLINKKQLATKDLNNVKAFIKDATLVGSSLLLLNELPDKAKQKLEDALNMAYGVVYPENWSRQIGNPIPAISLLVDAFQTISVGLNGSVYEQDTEYGDKGDYKIGGKIKQLAPQFVKPLLTKHISPEIKEINELSRQVDKAYKNALLYRTGYYIEEYNRLADELEMKKANSMEYQQKQSEQEIKSLENKLLLQR